MCIRDRGNGAIGKVSYVEGPGITTITSTITTKENVVLVSNGNVVTAINSEPHGLANNISVEIIGISTDTHSNLTANKTISLKDKTFVVYTDGVTEGYLKNGQELGAEGVQKIVKGLNDITPKILVDSIANELNWGAEKLRDDITCLALDLKNTELLQVKKKRKEEKKSEN